MYSRVLLRNGRLASLVSPLRGKRAFAWSATSRKPWICGKKFDFL